MYASSGLVNIVRYCKALMVMRYKNTLPKGRPIIVCPNCCWVLVSVGVGLCLYLTILTRFKRSKMYLDWERWTSSLLFLCTSMPRKLETEPRSLKAKRRVEFWDKPINLFFLITCYQNVIHMDQDRKEDVRTGRHGKQWRIHGDLMKPQVQSVCFSWSYLALSVCFNP